MMTAAATRSSAAAFTARPALAPRRARAVAARAEGAEAPKPVEAAPAVTPLAAAAPTPVVEAPKPAPPPPAPKAPTFGDVMAFSGPGPEIINSRLAMLAFVAAVGAELSTQESVGTQFAAAPLAVLGAGALFAAASIIPMLKGAKREAVGPFSPAAELVNGRAAMLGFASLLAVEALRGGALF